MKLDPKIQSVVAQLKDAAGILKSLGQISNEDRKVIEEAFAPIRDAFPSRLTEEQQILSRFEFVKGKFPYLMDEKVLRRKMVEFSKLFALTNGFDFQTIFNLVNACNQEKNSTVFGGTDCTWTMWVLK